MTETSRGEGGSSAGRTVLLVDDENLVRGALRVALEAGGHTICDEATDAKTAVSLAVLHEPDVVVLDHHLGGRFGGDMVADLLAAVPGIAVVLYTANDSGALQRQAIEAGAAAVVDKAAGLDELLKVIADLP